MKKNKKKIIITLISSLLIIGISATLFFAFYNKRKEDIVDIEPMNAEEYYKENGEIVSIIKVTESKDIPSEKEACDSFVEREFTEYPITTEFLMNGDYIDKVEIDPTSSDRHPIYVTYYLSSNGYIWTIESINGMVTAYPVSYNEELGSDVPVIIVEDESKTVFSYDCLENVFYETIPNDTSVTIKRVDKINKEMLDKLDKEGIDNL